MDKFGVLTRDGAYVGRVSIEKDMSDCTCTVHVVNAVRKMLRLKLPVGRYQLGWAADGDAEIFRIEKSGRSDMEIKLKHVNGPRLPGGFDDGVVPVPGKSLVGRLRLLREDEK